MLSIFFRIPYYSPLIEGWQPKADGVFWPTGSSTKSEQVAG